MRRALALVISLVALAGVGSAHAVSDGVYDPARQHCSGHADNSDAATVAEPGCYTVIYTLSDGTGHEYLGAGIRQVADGDFPHVLDVWVDAGNGTRSTITFDDDGPHAPVTDPGTAADPTTGLHLYFGADDNLDVGEHDSSDQINNGPSDGGAIQINLSKATADAWLNEISAGDLQYLFTHPVPGLDAGTGACADGLCFAITSQRRVAFQGGARGKSRDVANYEGKQWDPASCDGGSDSAATCGGQPIRYWADLEGTVYVEPGIQIYEDPDPQASPLDPYPIPALYVGPCGVVFGGADLAVPDGPFTNSAHQLVIQTECG